MNQRERRAGRARQRRGGAAWFVIAALLAAPALGLGAWAAVEAAPDPTLSGRDVEPVVVPVTHAERRATTSLMLSVLKDDPHQVLAATSGIVTQAPERGVTLNTGDVVLEIDDRPVLAMVADAPLWRPLAQGARGADVQRLEEFLNATGHFTGTPDDRFDAATRAAVSAFARDLGLPRGTTTFNPAWVLWVGPEPLVVESVYADVGTTLTPGAPVLSGPVRASAIFVAEPGGGLGAEFGEIADLEVQGVLVPYTVRSGRITAPDDVAAIVAALGPTTEAMATVHARTAAQVLVVPASAIVTGVDGAVCVYPDEHSAPIRVTAVGGGGASIQLADGIELTTVLANPGFVPGLTPCG